MKIICLVTVIINMGSINFFQKEQVQGKLLKESDTMYLVDFTGASLNVAAEDDSKVLVDKKQCIK